MARRKRKGAFALGMVIYAVIFLAITAAGLYVFWDFIETYERSRIKNTIDQYVAELTLEGAPSFTVPTARRLSISSLTTPSLPTTASTLVAVNRGVKYFFAMGLSSQSSRPDTTTNRLTCNHRGPCSKLVINPAREPAANQRDVMLTLAVSIQRNTTISTSHIIAAQFILNASLSVLCFTFCAPDQSMPMRMRASWESLSKITVFSVPVRLFFRASSARMNS